MYFSWLILFSAFTFTSSILYFYLYTQKREKFLKYWGFSWIAYSLSLLALLCYLNTGSELFMELRKVVDMFNLLLLLFGSYSFVHIRIPAYWYRFSLYLLLLSAICILYKFELLSFYLPISIYQLILTIFICYNIWKLWNIVMSEKFLASVIFLAWGVTKSLLSISELFMEITYSSYITEILLFNIVNFCILVIYIRYTQSEKNLASSLYKTVVENSTDTLFYYKLEPYKAFEYMSPSIKDVTGFSQSEFYDNPEMFLKLTDEKHTEEMKEIFSPEGSYKDISVIEMVKKNGSSFWGEFSCIVINNDEDVPVAIEGTLRDITRMKTAELEQINATKSRNMLLSYISHELRTPITSMAGYLTAMNDGIMSSDEEKQEAMDIITSKTLTLKKLIDDLDQLSKLETHQFTFDFMLTSAGDTAEQLTTSALGDLRTSGFEVSMECDLKELSKHWIIIDYDRIYQVFSNLITNAIKYSQEEKFISLEFKIDDAQENFVISVKDHGIGIKEEHVPHIFDRFYRAGKNDSSQLNIEGRGLGLTLCKEIMTAHQGDIYAESTYGFGSTFTFIIPLYKEA